MTLFVVECIRHAIARHFRTIFVPNSQVTKQQNGKTILVNLATARDGWSLFEEGTAVAACFS